MHMSVLPTYTHVYHVCALCPQRQEEGVRSSETRVKDVCKLLCRAENLGLVLLS